MAAARPGLDGVESRCGCTVVPFLKLDQCKIPEGQLARCTWLSIDGARAPIALTDQIADVLRADHVQNSLAMTPGGLMSIMSSWRAMRRLIMIQ